MLIPDHSMLHLQTIDNNNVSIYCLGGAVSVDRVNRIPSKSYWWNEMVPDLPQQELDKIPKGIDIVLTHTRPQGIFPIDKNGIEHWLLRDRGLDHDLGVELGRITKVFDAINKKNTCYTHYYGHFHMSNTEHFGDIKHQLLNIDELIEKIDIIPASIALAQAAKESGWGTSRFALEGNAIFGQWTWNGVGIEPLEKVDGQKHKILKFPLLRASVKAYITNLNTHSGYKGFRKKRLDMRSQNKKLSGLDLIHELGNYAQTGKEYTKILEKIIKQNDLDEFETVKINDFKENKQLKL